MDKTFWHEIIDNDYELPDDQDLVKLTKELLEYLSSPDPELRDEFAYGILARWIVNYRYHDHDDLLDIYPILMQQMQYQIGVAGDDTVFMRSYSALVLSLIVYRDIREGFLTELDLQAILRTALDYLRQEKDTRAHVAGKGWATAIGNACDVLKFIVRHELLSSADVVQVLRAIADKVLQPTDAPYDHDEEERLARVVTSALMRDALSSMEMIDWLQTFTAWRDDHRIEANYDYESNVIYQNSKRFLWAVYIQLQLAPRLPYTVQEFEPELLRALRKFSL
jgi:hypothetical protein